ncbi:MAG TPA: hypothetical protein ENI15_08875 [Spirochaetes bacterium]|nr:hypothetical protein [Spirochaetota bacterium]
MYESRIIKVPIKTSKIKLISGILSLSAGSGVSFFAFSLRYLYKSDTPGTDIPHIIAVAGSIIGFGILWFFDRKKSAAFGPNVPGSRGNYRRLFIVPAAFSINILSLFYYLAKSGFSTKMTLINNLLNMNNSRVFVSLVSGSLYAIIALLFYAGLNILNPKKVIRQFNLRVFALFCSIVLILTISYVRVFITHYTIFPKAAVLGGTGHTAGPWLTWHDDPKSAICVSWFTAEKKGTRMYYGKDPDNLNLTASRKDDVFLHKVFIENLSPDTIYYYRIHETFETPHSSVLFSFRTAPDVQRPFEFIVLGDMQPGDDITENANRIFISELLLVSDKDTFDFIIQLGDLTETGEDVEAWHRVLNNLSRISALHPTMTAIGNHEWGLKGKCRCPGRYRF